MEVERLKLTIFEKRLKNVVTLGDGGGWVGLEINQKHTKPGSPDHEDMNANHFHQHSEVA